MMLTLKSAGPSLKIVSTMSAGTDHIDTKYVSDNGIKLGSSKSLDLETPRGSLRLSLCSSGRVDGCNRRYCGHARLNGFSQGG
jgi:hypothetical protein